MTAKHDRQAVRKATDIERKYDLGKESAALNVAADAQRTAERASNAVDDLGKRVQELEKSSGGADLQSVYPVGSIYLSVLETNPADLFGFGTWVQIKDKFLLSAGDTYAAGSEGGAAEHTLTVEEIPAHKHNVYAEWGTSSNLNSSTTGGNYMQIAGANAGTQTPVDQMTETGGSQPHNNMPPYLAVYVWQRTA